MDASIGVLVSLIFFGAVSFFLVFNKFDRKKKIEMKKENEILIIALTILIGLMIRIVLAYQLPGWGNDIGSFRGWAGQASTVKGFLNFYAGLNDVNSFPYTPLYIYVLGPLGAFSNAIPGLTSKGAELIIKFPAIIADLGLAIYIYRVFYNKFLPQVRVALFMLIALNPLLIVNSSVWGQVDSIFILLIAVFMVLMAKDKIYLSTFFMGLALLFKPQAIFFLPVLMVCLLRRIFAGNIRKTKIESLMAGWLNDTDGTKKSVKYLSRIAEIIICAAIGAATFFMFSLPFAAPKVSDAFPLGESPFWIFNLYLNAGESLKFAAVSALNLFGLLGKNWVADSEILLILDYNTWGYILMGAGYAVSIVLFFIGCKNIREKKDGVLQKTPDNFTTLSAIFLSPVLMNVSMFMFGSRMHERYMVPVAVLLLFAYAYIKDIRIMILFAGFNITNLFNVLYLYLLKTNIPYESNGENIGYGWINNNTAYVYGFSALNLILTIFLFYTAFDILVLKNIKGRQFIITDKKEQKVRRKENLLRKG